MNTISIDQTAVDRVVSDLREHAASWAAVPLAWSIWTIRRSSPAAQKTRYRPARRRRRSGDPYGNDSGGEPGT